MDNKHFIRRNEQWGEESAMDPTSFNFTIDGIVFGKDDLKEALRKSFSRDPFDHYVSGIFGVFICILGCISNALSFSVLIRRTMRLSTYVYLAGLCLSDFAACLFVLPSYILNSYPLNKLDFELPRTYRYTQLIIITGRSILNEEFSYFLSFCVRCNQHYSSCCQCLALRRIYDRSVDKFVCRLISMFSYQLFFFLFCSDLPPIRWSTVLHNDKCTTRHVHCLCHWHILCDSTDVRICAPSRQGRLRYSPYRYR